MKSFFSNLFMGGWKIRGLGAGVLPSDAVNKAQLDAASHATAVSAGDTAPGYLFDKLVAGTNITLTKQNPGANENILIDASGGGGSPASNYGYLQNLMWG